MSDPSQELLDNGVGGQDRATDLVDRATGQPRASVDPQRDRAMALAETMQRARLGGIPNGELISLARRLDGELFTSQRLGPQTRVARARTLIAIYDLLNRRLSRTGLSPDGTAETGAGPYDRGNPNALPPSRPRDPLGGSLINVVPFGNIDMWHSIASAGPREAAVGRPIRRGPEQPPPSDPDPEPDTTEQEIREANARRRGAAAGRVTGRRIADEAARAGQVPGGAGQTADVAGAVSEVVGLSSAIGGLALGVAAVIGSYITTVLQIGDLARARSRIVGARVAAAGMQIYGRQLASRPSVSSPARMSVNGLKKAATLAGLRVESAGDIQREAIGAYNAISVEDARGEIDDTIRLAMREVEVQLNNQERRARQQGLPLRERNSLRAEFLQTAGREMMIEANKQRERWLPRLRPGRRYRR